MGERRAAVEEWRQEQLSARSQSGGCRAGRRQRVRGPQRVTEERRTPGDSADRGHHGGASDVLAQQRGDDEWWQERQGHVGNARAGERRGREQRQRASRAVAGVARPRGHGREHARQGRVLVVDEVSVVHEHRRARREPEGDHGARGSGALAYAGPKEREGQHVQDQERQAQGRFDAHGRAVGAPGLAPALRAQQGQRAPSEQRRGRWVVGVDEPGRGRVERVAGLVLGARQVDVEHRIATQRADAEALVVDGGLREERALEALDLAVEGACQVARARNQRCEQERGDSQALEQRHQRRRMRPPRAHGPLRARTMSAQRRPCSSSTATGTRSATIAP